jgi:hypothetical protein
MPLTTYTAGEVLTASSLNANLSFAAGSGGLTIVQNETSFTASTQIVANTGIFTSAYTAYKVILRFTGTTGGAMGLKLRVAGTPSSANYNQQILSANSTTVSAVRQASQTSFAVGAGSTGTFMQSVECLITGPALAETTTFQSNFQISDTALTIPGIQFVYGNHNVATAYDSFELNAASGNFTGVYTVYGLAKTGA